MTKQSKKPRQGEDWHGWALKAADKDPHYICWYAVDSRPKEPPPRGMIWVRVKFVEVSE